jgi:uncharacterized protein YjbJ (UPF0337 family)
MGERADKLRRERDFDDIIASGGFAPLTQEDAAETRVAPVPTSRVVATAPIVSPARVDQRAANTEVADAEATATDGEPAAMVTDIEQTRAEMSETIEAIQERLTPERVVDQAKDMASDTALAVVDHAVREAKAAVRELTGQAKGAVHDATVGKVQRVASTTGETTKSFGSSVVTTIKQNPGPAALTGLGLGWLILNGRSASSQGQSTQTTTRTMSSPSSMGTTGQVQEKAGQVTEQVRGTAGDLTEQVQGTAGQVQEKAGQVTDQVKGTAGQVAEQVKGTAGQVTEQAQGTVTELTHRTRETAGQLVGQVQQVRSRFQQTLQENPLPVGALAVVLGGASALAVPETQRENQLLGEVRDNLVDQTQATAQGVIEKVQRVAEEVQETAEKEARYQGLAPKE